MARKTIPESPLSSAPLNIGGGSGANIRASTAGVSASPLASPTIRPEKVDAFVQKPKVDRVGSVIDFNVAIRGMEKVNAATISFKDREDTLLARRMVLEAASGIQEQEMFFNPETKQVSGFLSVEKEAALGAFPQHRENLFQLRDMLGKRLNPNARQKYELLVQSHFLSAVERGARHANNQAKAAQVDILEKEYDALERESVRDPIALFSTDPETGKSRVVSELLRDPDTSSRVKKYDTILGNSVEAIAKDGSPDSYKKAGEFLAVHGAAASGGKKLYLQDWLEREQKAEEVRLQEEISDLLTTKRADLQKYTANDVGRILGTGGTVGQVALIHDTLMATIPSDRPELITGVESTFQAALLDGLDLLQKQQGTSAAEVHAYNLAESGVLSNASTVFGYGGRQSSWKTSDRAAVSREKKMVTAQEKDEAHTANLVLNQSLSAPIGQRPRFKDPNEMMAYIDKKGKRPFANLQPKTLDTLWKSYSTPQHKKLRDIQYLTKFIVEPMEKSNVSPQNATELMTIVQEKLGETITREAANQLFERFNLALTENGKWLKQQESAAQDVLRGAYPRAAQTFESMMLQSGGKNIKAMMEGQEPDVKAYYTHSARLTQIVSDTSVPVEERIKNLDSYYKENVKQYDENPIFATQAPPEKITGYVANSRQFDEALTQGQVPNTLAAEAEAGLSRVQETELSVLSPEDRTKAVAIGVSVLSPESAKAFDEALQQAYPGATFNPDTEHYQYTNSAGEVKELRNIQVSQ